jgi:hypothetical protein
MNKIKCLHCQRRYGGHYDNDQLRRVIIDPGHIPEAYKFIKTSAGKITPICVECYNVFNDAIDNAITFDGDKGIEILTKYSFAIFPIEWLKIEDYINSPIKDDEFERDLRKEVIAQLTEKA